MPKAVLLIAIAVIGAAASAYGQGTDPRNSLQQKLKDQFSLTSVTPDRSDITAAGTVVALRKAGFFGYSTASPVPYLNTYDKKGKITQPFMANLGAGVAGGLGSGKSNYPQRLFAAGEKFWIIGLFVQNDGITFRLYSDPYKGIRYYGDLKFPIEKGSVPTLDETLPRIAEVLAQSGTPTPPADGGKTPPKTPTQGSLQPVPLHLPATYVSVQTPTDQLQLNSDNSFSLQSAGQTTRGTFVVNGNTLEIKMDSDTTPMTIQGSNLTDPSGQTWTVRDQSRLQGQAPSTSVETQLRSQYPITSVDASGQVVQAGSVLVVEQMGILGLPAPTQWPCNSYKQGGRITQARLCELNYSISRNKTRSLQLNEKVYLTAIQFKLPEVDLTVQTGAGDANGTPFKAVILFEFQKNSYVDLSAIQKSISEVFTLDTTPPPHRGGLPHLPATYVNALTPTDQLQLNADNSFSLQAAGQTTRGTFAVNGNTLEIKIDGDTTPMTIKDSNLTDPSGQIWTLREQSAPTVPSETALRNEDIIKLAKVGIDDATIIAKIGSSKCQFDTSTDALVQLKQSGVSDAVLKAMLGAGK